MIDPLFLLPLSLGFAVFWAVSAYHKVRNLEGFKDVLRDYDVFPTWSLKSISVGVPALELTIATLLFAIPQLGAIASVALLLGYAVLLGFTALRGHALTDCGCGWGSAQDTTHNAPPMKLYVLRNVGLAIASGLILVPQTLRALTVFDWVNAVLATGCFIVLSAVLAKLFSNYNRMKVAGHV